MEHSAELRRCLEAMDVAAVRRLWQHVSPHLPQPKSDADAMVSLHHARTLMKSIAFKLRAYSHRWLLDNGYPSGLPDDLKPSAERIYPKIADAVGISVNFRSAEMKPAEEIVRGAMSEAVLESFADKVTDPALVSAHMARAKSSAIKSLFGRIIR